MNLRETLRANALLGVLCAAFAVLGYLRLNDTSLYTDSTRYVIWGTSFSHARGFVDNTQPDPERYVVNAPLYSVVLSPVLLFFPDSLLAAKVWTLLIGICALVLFYSWLERRYGKFAALFGALILAANPLMLVMATEAMSEMCFVAMAILAMILFETTDVKGQTPSGQSLGLLLILSFLPLLREISIALVAAIVLVLLMQKYYRYSLWIIGATGVLLAAWMVRNVVIVGVPPTSQSTNVNFIFGHFVTPEGTPLATELYQRILVNVRSFYVFTVSLLTYPFPQPLIVDPSRAFRFLFKSLSVVKYILPFVVLPLVVLGIIHDLRRSPRARAGVLFVVFYFVIIVLYPIQDARFLLPLLPFLIYYVFSAFHDLHTSAHVGPRKLWLGCAIVLGGLVVLPNLDCEFELVRTNWNYRHAPDELYAAITKTNANKELFVRPWQSFGDWVVSNIPDSAVVASTFKELSIFIGNRKILEINYGVPVPMFDRFLRDYGVGYVLSAGERENIRPYEFAMKESKRYWFEPVHGQLGLELYKVHSSYVEPPPVRTTAAEVPSDTISARALLALGRSMILQGQYERALNDLSAAGNHGADPALVAYQMTVAYALSYRPSDAARSLQQLYSLPQSTSYIPAARLHLQAMDTYLDAAKSTNVYQRSAQFLDVATFYWNFGYRQQAHDLLRTVLQKDTTYFTGLLWAWDFATELGDNAQATGYLKTLEAIDTTNAVVLGYRKLVALSDTLRRTRNSKERSRLRLAQAAVYSNIGLSEEAFDYTYRSIGEDRGNEAAYRYLADMFHTSDRPWAVREVRLSLARPH